MKIENRKQKGGLTAPQFRLIDIFIVKYIKKVKVKKKNIKNIKQTQFQISFNW